MATEKMLNKKKLIAEIVDDWTIRLNQQILASTKTSTNHI